MNPFPPIESVSGQVGVIPGDDVDTDRIIPARFMTSMTFEALRDKAFFDVRHDPDGTKNDSPLNQPPFDRANILLVGRNFGCGSSREHAPQALLRWNAGIHAILGVSFAEIFQGNAHALGIPCITITEETRSTIEEILATNPMLPVEIQLNRAGYFKDRVSIPIICGDRTVYGELSPGALYAFLHGIYDQLAELIEGSHETEERMKQLNYL